MKLSSKIIIITSGTLLIAGALVISIVFSSLKFSIEESIGNNQLLIAQTTIDKIDRLLFERHQDIRSIAEDESIEGFLENTKEQDIDGDLKEEAKRRMGELTQLTGPWDIFIVTDTEGLIVLSTEEWEEGTLSSEDERDNKIAWEHALRGEVYYSDALIYTETGKPSIIFSAPIYSENTTREITGVVIGALSWSVVTEILDEIHLPITLINKDGLVIHDNEPHHQDRNFTEDLSNYEAVKHVFAGNNTTKIHIATHNILPGEDSEAESLVSHVLQQGYLSYKGSGWALLVEVPTEIAFASARQTAFQTGLILILSFFFTIVTILFFLAKFISRPIISLTNTVKKMSNGDLTIRAHVNTDDEIGQLAGSFNQMTNNLFEAQKIPKNILRSMEDGLFVVDNNGIISEVNESALNLLGYTKEELIGKSVSIIFKNTSNNK
ncbi:HAMP domain-containing protein [Candidatus Pacebacteria bacterium]|nr:HAMP domain-containing protein [Candidatus Paceibacterota bacterium]